MSDLKNMLDESALDAHWDTLTIFEQILEHTPEDVEALKEVFRASIAVDEKRRADNYGARLGRLALATGDLTNIQQTLDILAPHTAMGKDIDAVVSDLFHAVTAAAAAAAPEIAEPDAAAGTNEDAAAEDRSLATSSGDVDANEIIAIVSRVLEEMPDDRESLEMLATAYLKAGNGVQAAQTLARLANVLMQEQDRDEAAAVYEKLAMLQAIAPDVTPTVSKLERFLAGEATDEDASQTAAEEPLPAKPPSLDITPAKRRDTLTDEMDLLWDMRQQGLVTEELYAGVVSDLTDLISNETITTISALHGLSFRSAPNLEGLLVQLAAKTATPIVALANFDLQTETLMKLPFQYITMQGVIPFDKMGDEYLIAVLNPYSQRLRQEIRAAMGSNCHFFLVQPADFDAALELAKTRYLGTN